MSLAPRQLHCFTGRNTRPLQARDVGQPQRMETHPKAALILQQNVCGLEIRPDHFHRRNPFGKHQSFRRHFSG
jgi:hypothetical protein